MPWSGGSGVLPARHRERDRWCSVRLIIGGTVLALISAASAATAEPAPIRLELNRLEPVDTGCRVYLVVGNDGAQALESLKLDLVLFGSDGVIDRRLALEAGPAAGGQDQRQAVRPHRSAVHGPGQHPGQRRPGLPRGRRRRAGLLRQAGPGDAHARQLHQVARRGRLWTLPPRRRPQSRTLRSIQPSSTGRSPSRSRPICRRSRCSSPPTRSCKA